MPPYEYYLNSMPTYGLGSQHKVLHGIDGTGVHGWQVAPLQVDDR